MPDEPQPSQDEPDTPASDETQPTGPDLSKRGRDEAPPPTSQPPAASPYESANPWTGGAYPQPSQYGQAPYGQAPYGQPQYGQAQYGQAPYGTPPQYGAPPQPYGAPPPPGYPQPYGPGGYAPYGPRNSGKATTVLVLGVASLVLLFMCGVGLVTAIVALVMAPGAKREIEESQGRLAGLSLVQGGTICSWITIGLVLLGVAVWMLLMALGSSLWGYDYGGV